MFSFLFQSL